MNKARFEGAFANDIEAFLAHKRALGFPYVASERLLARFDRFCISNFPDEMTLTREIALSWAELRDGEHPNTRIRKVSPVRGLAEYIIRHGGSAYVIPRNTLSSEVPYVPYIYTVREITRLLDACDELAAGPKGGGYRLILPCVIRLLYATGMRQGEVRALVKDSVDLVHNSITVGPSKTTEGRLVYIADDICDSLERFDYAAESFAPKRRYFFSKLDGGMQSARWLQMPFVAAKCLAEIDELGVDKRVHDLRHTFCVHKLNQWVHEGKDTRVMLPYLSTYIGHKTLSSTDYYLHLIPEFYPDYSDLTTNRNLIIPEVGSDRNE